jgi:hypothetical protein
MKMIICPKKSAVTSVICYRIKAIRIADYIVLVIILNKEAGIMIGKSSILVLLVGVISCSRESQEIESHTFRVYNDHGVTIAQSSGTPKYGGELFEYEKIVTLHEDEANPESLLNLPGSSRSSSSFTVDASGYFYVADTRNHRIAVFGPEGEYERSMGREGDGPGDLQSPIRIVEANGVLYVKGSNQRTTLYSTDGTLIEVITHRNRGNGIWRSGDYYINVQGRSNPPDFTTWQSSALVKNTDGDTLADLHTPEITIAVFIIAFRFIDNRQYTRPQTISYHSWPQIILLRNRQFLLYAGLNPELLYYSINGELIKKVIVDIPAVPVSILDKQKIVDRIRELALKEPEDPEFVPFKISPSNVPYPSHKAPWNTIEVDDYNYTWLQVSIPASPFSPIGREPVEYRLLSPEGEYLGTTFRPVAESGQVARGYYLALVRDPESGAAIPTVYRIKPVVSGLRYP